MSTAQRITAQSTTGETSPGRRTWTQQLGINHGEWLILPKAQLAADYQNTGTPAPQRVYALLQLHSFGFQQAVAVYQVPNHTGRGAPEERIMTPGVIALRLGLSRQNTRRALAKLEQLGKIERQPIPDKRTGKQRRIEGTPVYELLRDQVQIYVHPTPREPTAVPPKPSALERYLRLVVPRPPKLRNPEVRARYEAMLQDPELQAAAYPGYQAYQAQIDTLKAARKQAQTDYQAAVLVVNAELKKANLVVTSGPVNLMDERTTESKSTTERKPNAVSRGISMVPVSECGRVDTPPAGAAEDRQAAQQIKSTLESELHCKLPASDQLPQQFVQLAKTTGLPAQAVPLYIRFLMKTKADAGYTLTSPGAVLQFARRGYQGWVMQNKEAVQQAINDSRSHTPTGAELTQIEAEHAQQTEQRRAAWDTYDSATRADLKQFYPGSFDELPS